MYEVRNISFSYKSERTLRDVSFVVSPGEFVALVGPNGAGKTTLLKILAGLYVSSSGVILHDGQNVLLNIEKYRRQIGYLPERIALYEDMTVRDYLTYRAVIKGELSRRIRRRVEEAIEMCLLRECLKSRIGKLSYGLQKRVALADALLLRPRVLILDDLFSGLDYKMRSSIGEIIRNAASFSSVIVSGHEIADFASWASSFIVLSDGIVSSVIPAAGVDTEALIERVNEAIGEVS
jgi:ABC-2 type transport system ATP-binding protein